ncbi:hypothetical protein VN97_g4579 [Penicillium thymicola]|uniref:Uncharacterized protein n=1 Tax=Penicillium thymicola TaxID=293382 RepID=A0AAI9TK06_PENTH|nr:hypothetical protein VN97_g4579 [Penicillium thymicola]
MNFYGLSQRSGWEAWQFARPLIALTPEFDSIQIRSRFDSDSVQIQFRFSSDSVQIQFRSNSDSIQIQFGI